MTEHDPAGRPPFRIRRATAPRRRRSRKKPAQRAEDRRAHAAAVRGHRRRHARPIDVFDARGEAALPPIEPAPCRRRRFSFAGLFFGALGALISLALSACGSTRSSAICSPASDWLGWAALGARRLRAPRPHRRRCRANLLALRRLAVGRYAAKRGGRGDCGQRRPGRPRRRRTTCRGHRSPTARNRARPRSPGRTGRTTSSTAPIWCGWPRRELLAPLDRAARDDDPRRGQARLRGHGRQPARARRPRLCRVRDAPA